MICPECGWPRREVTEGAKCWRYRSDEPCRRECDEGWTQVNPAIGGQFLDHDHALEIKREHEERRSVRRLIRSVRGDR